jgi:hypothetical protein
MGCSAHSRVATTHGGRRRKRRYTRPRREDTPAAAALGLAETERSLTEGRVRHLLVDAEAPEEDLSKVEDDLVARAPDERRRHPGWRARPPRSSASTAGGRPAQVLDP